MVGKRLALGVLVGSLGLPGGALHFRPAQLERGELTTREVRCG
jgi:hypothetical protein